MVSSCKRRCSNRQRAKRKRLFRSVYISPLKSLSPISVLSLFFALTSTALLSGCGDESPTTSSAPPPAVSSKLPSGWTHNANYPVGDGQTADYVDLAPSNGGFSANVMAVSTPASGYTAAQAMAMEISMARATAGISGVVVDSNSAISVGGKPGHRGQLRYAQEVNGTTYQILTRELLVVYNGKDIQILMKRLQDDSAAAAAFREVEASIVLN